MIIITERKIKFALLSIISNTVLIVFKVIAGILSGSISIISEALHSGMDLAASIIAFFSVRTSSKPADREHPYGHGKIENISGLAEGLLIFIAAALIISEAVKKLHNPIKIEQAWVAIAVMFVSAAINFIVSKKLFKVAREEDSMALEADALHLKTDVYTSVGVGVGILLIKLTGLAVLDPLVAILVAVLIFKEAWKLCKTAFNSLLDSRLSDEEEAEIQKIINSHCHCFINYHKLKTRKSGNIKHIDFHITMECWQTVEEAHQVIASLKKAIGQKLINTRVSIHIDPYRYNEED